MSVVVLQHPDESRINKGTAIIAKLSLTNYQCWQGEDFSSHNQLNELINSCADEIAVVYPSDQANSMSDLLNDKKRPIKHVIFIDATWRKAKKIWALSTNLHPLMSLQLDALNKSNYRIRKVPADGYLSSIEAITQCLSDLDDNSEKYSPMLSVFDAMIDYQIDQMGVSTYTKNYKK